MRMSLTVEFINGDKVDTEAVFADFVAFERTWQRSVAQLEHSMRLTDLAWLAWHSQSRQRATTLKFDPDWVETVVSVGPTEAEEDPSLPLAPSAE